jgi:hypothetical protein
MTSLRRPLLFETLDPPLCFRSRTVRRVSTRWDDQTIMGLAQSGNNISTLFHMKDSPHTALRTLTLSAVNRSEFFGGKGGPGTRGGKGSEVLPA